MSPLDDAAIGRLRAVLALPDLGDERYELLAPLGEGGMGVVYRARDRRLDREVAIKLLRPDAVGAADVVRLRREAGLLARLEHPGIVPVHDVGATPDGRAFLVMKLVEGRGLDAVTREGAALGELLRVFLRLCETIAYAHSVGIVHRDLKPANVMVGAFGEVLAMDWGVARREGASGSDGGAGATVAHAGATRDGTVVGTPGFMAPEQARGDGPAVGRHSDVYALGRVLETLLDAPGPAGAAGPRRSAPAPLRSIVARATAEDPGQRYPGVAELAADVRRHLDGERVLAHRDRWPERLGRAALRHRVAIGLLLAYVAMRALLFAIQRR